MYVIGKCLNIFSDGTPPQTIMEAPRRPREMEPRLLEGWELPRNRLGGYIGGQVFACTKRLLNAPKLGAKSP